MRVQLVLEGVGRPLDSHGQVERLGRDGQIALSLLLGRLARAEQGEHLLEDVLPPQPLEHGPGADEHLPAQLGRLKVGDLERGDQEGREVAEDIRLAGLAIGAARHLVDADRVLEAFPLVLDPRPHPLRLGEIARHPFAQAGQQSLGVVDDAVDGQVVGDLGLARTASGEAYSASDLIPASIGKPQ